MATTEQPTTAKPGMTPEQQELATKFIPMAHKEALFSQKISGLPLDELTAEALLHLARAAAWFDPAKGYPFAPIAAKIVRQGLQRYSEMQMHRGLSFSDIESDHEDFRLDPAAPPPAPPSVDYAEAVERVKQACKSPIDWTCVWLHHGMGLTLEEIANRLSVTPNAVGVRVRNTIKRVQRSYKVKRLKEVA